MHMWVKDEYPDAPSSDRQTTIVQLHKAWFNCGPMLHLIESAAHLAKTSYTQEGVEGCPTVPIKHLSQWADLSQDSSCQ